MSDEKDPDGEDRGPGRVDRPEGPEGPHEEGDFDAEDFDAADRAWANIARRREEGHEPDTSDIDPAGEESDGEPDPDLDRFYGDD